MLIRIFHARTGEKGTNNKKCGALCNPKTIFLKAAHTTFIEDIPHLTFFPCNCLTFFQLLAVAFTVFSSPSPFLFFPAPDISREITEERGRSPLLSCTGFALLYYSNIKHAATLLRLSEGRETTDHPPSEETKTWFELAGTERGRVGRFKPPPPSCDASIRKEMCTQLATGGGGEGAHEKGKSFMMFSVH